MSTLGGFNANIVSGGAQLTTSAADLQKKVVQIGVCTSGVVNQLYTPSGAPAARTAGGAGPLVEEVGIVFGTPGPQIVTPPAFIPADPTVAGGVGTVTAPSGALATITADSAPHVPITGTCSAGALGTMEATFTVNGGTPFTVTSEAGGSWAYRVLGTFCTVTFPSATYTGSETFSIGVDGTVTSNGSAATPATVSSAVGPFDFRGLLTPNIQVAFNAGGDQNFNITAATAVKAGSGATGNYPITGTFDVIFSGGYSTTVTVTAAADATAMAAQVNAQINAGHANVNGTEVDLVSDRSGTSATATVTNAACLGFTNGTATGTGTVANDGAVTAAELAAICTVTNGTATDSGGALVFTSTTTGTGGTVQVKSASTADTVMGFDNSVHQGAAAGPIAGLSQQSSPVDNYDLEATAVVGGALGTAMLSISLDGGNTTIPTLSIPASGTVVVPGTGVVLTCDDNAGDFVAGQKWTMPCAAPTCSSSDITDALDALLADTTSPAAAVIHITTLPASAAAAISLAETVQSFLDTAKAAGKQWEAVIECPYVGDILANSGSPILDTADTNAVIRAARVGTTANNVSIGVGTHRFAGSSGRQIRRGAGLAVACRVATAFCSDSVCNRELGPLPVTEIGRDERAEAISLFDVQFTTLQTVDTLAGVYFSIERGGYGWRNLTVDANYQDADSLRALNAAVATVNPVGQRQVGKRFPLNSDGTIEAKRRGALSDLFNGVFNRAAGIGRSASYNGVPQASAVSALVDPSSNLGPTGDKVIKVNGTWESLGLGSAIDFTVYYGASA
jgi:hypothetical protein